MKFTLGIKKNKNIITKWFQCGFKNIAGLVLTNDVFHERLRYFFLVGMQDPVAAGSFIKYLKTQTTEAWKAIALSKIAKE